jgi:biotin carboxyl carrier protein
MSDDRTAETTVMSRSPVLGTVVQVSVTAGDRVAVGDTLVVTESM